MKSYLCSIATYLSCLLCLSARSRRVLMLGLISIAVNSPVAAGSVIYLYDSLGRVVKVSYSNGVVISYVYDAAGNRISSVTTGVTVANTAQ